jgi:hypothetical protein
MTFPVNGTMAEIIAFLEKIIKALKKKALGKRQYARDFST